MRLAAAALALVLSGCATIATPPASAPTFDAATMVRAIRSAGAALPTEVEVQPLQDALVSDLRQQATREAQAGRIDAASATLDRAIAERPQEPALLQERAELALLTHRTDAAFDFARRAHAVGPTVGPLCRRSLETLVQIERLRASTDPAAATRADAFARQRDACTVKPPARY